MFEMTDRKLKTEYMKTQNWVYENSKLVSKVEMEYLKTQTGVITNNTTEALHLNATKYT